ncbi:MAG: hypothetical protein Kow00127_08250 [Bacteroidales bacterium]
MQFKYFLPLLFILVGVACNKEENSDDNCQPVAPDPGQDRIIDEGSSVTLSVAAGYDTYQWSTGEEGTQIEVDSAGSYWVKVTQCGKTLSDTVKVYLRYKTIRLETDSGTIRFWLYPKTRLHRENFLELAGSGFYDGLLFHRVVAGFVIQGGDPEGTGYGGPGYTIPAEIYSSPGHLFGAVGAARLGDDVNPERESNGSQFYIVSDPNGEPGLNGAYTVFGQVFDGLDVVTKLSQVPVDNQHRPLTDLPMLSVSIEYYSLQELADNFGFVPEIPSN